MAVSSRRVSTSKNTYMVSSGQGPTKLPAKKTSTLKSKATASLKGAASR